MNGKSIFATGLTTMAIGFVAFSLPAQAATELKTIACFQRNHDYVQALHQKFVEPMNAADQTGGRAQARPCRHHFLPGGILWRSADGSAPSGGA